MSIDPSPKIKFIADAFYLALVVWREARGEGEECMTAVASSVMNRVKKPGWWGKDLISVVTKPWQYSSMTDPKDPQIKTWPQPADATWWAALRIAASLLEDTVTDTVGGADSYYDISIPPPKWADPTKFVKQVGRVKFYKLA